MTTTINQASPAPSTPGTDPENTPHPLTALVDLSFGDMFARTLGDLNLGSALEAIQKGLVAVAERLTNPDLEREFTQFELNEKLLPEVQEPLAVGDPRATLPALMKTAQHLTTLVQGVQSRLDGTMADAYRTPGQKFSLLGIPEGRDGYRGPDHLLQDTVDISPGEARRRAQTAQHFQPHRPTVHPDDGAGAPEPNSPQGRLARLFPQLTAAFHASRISQAHLHQLLYAVNAIDLRARECDYPREELEARYRKHDAELTDKALTTSYTEFQRFLYAWRTAVITDITPDAAATSEERINARRGLHFTGEEGGLKLWTLGTDDEGHELLSCIRGAANNPRQRTEEADPTLVVFDDDDADSDRIRDGRTPTQRAHDGLLAVLSAGLRVTENGLPDQGGQRPQIIVTAGLTALLKVAHSSGLLPNTFNTALLDGGSTRDLLISAGYTGPTGPGMLRRMVCTADITTAVLGTQGEVLDVAIARRHFSLKQRRALTARDGGCAAPGCTFPASWCDAHHVKEWSEGGPTTVDNGVLLCNHHHRSVHLGMWVIEMRDGIPWFAPTAKLRPEFAEKPPGFGPSDSGSSPPVESRRNTSWVPHSVSHRALDTATRPQPPRSTTRQCNPAREQDPDPPF